MTYRATPRSTSQSPEDMRHEGIRILTVLSSLHLINETEQRRYISDRFTETERKFLGEMMDLLHLTDDSISVKQLFYLRDIKDKYL